MQPQPLIFGSEVRVSSVDDTLKSGRNSVRVYVCGMLCELPQVLAPNIRGIDLGGTVLSGSQERQPVVIQPAYIGDRIFIRRCTQHGNGIRRLLKHCLCSENQKREN